MTQHHKQSGINDVLYTKESMKHDIKRDMGTKILCLFRIMQTFPIFKIIH